MPQHAADLKTGIGPAEADAMDLRYEAVFCSEMLCSRLLNSKLYGSSWNGNIVIGLLSFDLHHNIPNTRHVSILFVKIGLASDRDYIFSFTEGA